MRLKTFILTTKSQDCISLAYGDLLYANSIRLVKKNIIYKKWMLYDIITKTIHFVMNIIYKKPSSTTISIRPIKRTGCDRWEIVAFEKQIIRQKEVPL